MGFLRIIAGELKGRRIRAPRGSATRPTAERVREALFGILGAQVARARVLDAFAGSGALGFEALSRGASEVVFVESRPDALRALRENREALDTHGRCRILPGRVRTMAVRGRLDGHFDLILADPPYGAGEGAEFLRWIVQQRLLAPGGRLVLERSARSPEQAAEGLDRERSARYGDSRLDFYRLAPASEPPAGT